MSIYLFVTVQSTFFGVFFFCPFKLTPVLLYVDQLKLDDKEINSTDFWKRQILIASMHKQPASFGIYVPAKDEAIVEGGNNRRVCNIEIEHVGIKMKSDKLFILHLGFVLNYPSSEN
jgi:hypothetical protein